MPLISSLGRNKLGRKGEDLTGQKFGRLTVLEKDVNSLKRSRWICRCECGKIKYIYATLLKQGNTNSCGCLRRDLQRRPNDYYFIDDIGVMKIKDKEILFDKEDFELIKNYSWNIDKINEVKADINKQKYRIHQLIMGTKGTGLVVDHINRNRLDNRKSNLRICTQQQNMYNKTVKSNNLYGQSGVCWSKSAKKWESRLAFEKKTVARKLFNNYPDALEFRLMLQQIYFKDFSPMARKEV